MPESDTEYLDYYPPGWTEHIIDDVLVEWALDEDEEIFVRLDGSMEEDQYSVSSITGVNDRGEEFVTSSLDGLTEETAFDAAQTLIYAMNGTLGRMRGEDQYTGDQ